MPELPEVETIRRGLAELLPGRQIASAEHDTARSFPNAPTDVEQFLVGRKVTAVRRRAKVLLIDLDSDYSLVVHLRMTGQLVFIQEGLAPPLDAEMNSSSSPLPLKDASGALAAQSRALRASGDDSANPSLKGRSSEFGVSESVTPNSQPRTPNSETPLRFGAGHPTDSLLGQLPDKSTRVTIEFSDGAQLFFNDQRKFGWMKLMPTIEVPNIDFMKRVGPEPLEVDFTPEQFADRFTRRARTSIKAALLDQSVIAGVGNIYADESLWGAQIHPKRLTGSVTPEEFELLFEQLRAVLNLSIEKGGSTDKNYLNAEGGRGSYLDFARVFRREGLACYRCGDQIVKLKVAGRGTHICPTCQVE